MKPVIIQTPVAILRLVTFAHPDTSRHSRFKHPLEINISPLLDNLEKRISRCKTHHIKILIRDNSNMLGRIQPIQHIPFQDSEVKTVLSDQFESSTRYSIAKANVKFPEIRTSRSYLSHRDISNIRATLNTENLKARPPVTVIINN